MTTITSTSRFIMMEQEAQAILDSAEECSAGECSLDDVSALIHQLKEQERVLQGRIDKVMNMVSHLQHANVKENRSAEELRKLVQDTLRVFTHEKTRFPASGYSGEVGKGSKTAWDVLPPRKWNP